MPSEGSNYIHNKDTLFKVSPFVGILGIIFLFVGFYTIVSSCFRLRNR